MISPSRSLVDDEVRSCVRSLVAAGADQVGPHSTWVQSCVKMLRDWPPAELRGCIHVSQAQHVDRRIPVLVHWLGSTETAHLHCWRCFQPPTPTMCCSCFQSPASSPGLRQVVGALGDHIFLGAVCRACRAEWDR